MPTYITLVRWTEEGVRNVNDTVSRVQQAGAAAEPVSRRLVRVWWTEGRYDLLGVWELPDDETTSALILVGHAAIEWCWSDAAEPPR